MTTRKSREPGHMAGLSADTLVRGDKMPSSDVLFRLMHFKLMAVARRYRDCPGTSCVNGTAKSIPPYGTPGKQFTVQSRQTIAICSGAEQAASP